MSNGPNDDEGWEECDDYGTDPATSDPNMVDGDGCSSDCKLENTSEWECPVWGQKCNLICGNGVRDTVHAYTVDGSGNVVFQYDADGNPIMVTEECDLGANNGQKGDGAWADD